MTFNKNIPLLLRSMGGLTILACAIYYFDIGSVWTKIKDADIRSVILVFFFGILVIFIYAFRLTVCLGYIVKVPFRKVLLSILTGKVFGCFAPGTLGTDLSVILSLRSVQNGILTIGSILVVDRIISLFSIIILIFFLLPFSFTLMPLPIQHIIQGLIFLGIIIIIVLPLLYLSKFRSFTRTINCKLRSWSLHPFMKFPVLAYQKWQRTLAIITIGILLNACTQCGIYFMLHAVHLKVGFLYVLAVLPLNSFLIMIPVSIMGIGLREGGFYYLLLPFRITMEEVIAFNMIGYLVEFFIILIAGSIMLYSTLKSFFCKGAKEDTSICH